MAYWNDETVVRKTFVTPHFSCVFRPSFSALAVQTWRWPHTNPLAFVSKLANSFAGQSARLTPVPEFGLFTVLLGRKQLCTLY